MKLLNEEQRVYLFSLESKKKRRKYLLDCLVENVLGAEVKDEGILSVNEAIDYLKNTHFQFSTTTAPRTFEGILKPEANELLKFEMLKDEKCDVCKLYPKIVNSNKCESCHAFVKHTVATSDVFKNLKSINHAETSLPKEEILSIFEVNKNDKNILQIYLNVLIKQQRYSLVKIFKNQIEIIDLIDSIKKDVKNE